MANQHQTLKTKGLGLVGLDGLGGRRTFRCIRNQQVLDSSSAAQIWRSEAAIHPLLLPADELANSDPALHAVVPA
jgi:hypothetical protein